MEQCISVLVQFVQVPTLGAARPDHETIRENNGIGVPLPARIEELKNGPSGIVMSGQIPESDAFDQGADALALRRYRLHVLDGGAEGPFEQRAVSRGPPRAQSDHHPLPSRFSWSESLVHRGKLVWPRAAAPDRGVEYQRVGAEAGRAGCPAVSRIAAPATADSNEPASTAILIMASCSASAKASKPMKRLMVKPMPQKSATP